MISFLPFTRAPDAYDLDAGDNDGNIPTLARQASWQDPRSNPPPPSASCLPEEDCLKASLQLASYS